MDTLTSRYRDLNRAVRAKTIRDLQKIWPALDWRRLDETYPAWLTGVQAIVSRDRSASVGLAATYVRAFRLSSGVPGEAKIVLAPPMDPKQFAVSMRVTSVAAVKKSTAAGKTAERAMADAFVMSAGAATRLVLNAGRDTVRESSIADPRCSGWQRVTSGGCDFCQMLAGRGVVYSEASADFESHDHCACSAEPAYT